MIRLRFLQLSDLHFGAPMTSSRLGLPPDKQAQRQAEFSELVASLPSLVAQYHVDAVLMPGDIWDHEKLDNRNLEQFRQLYTALCNLPVPVVIAPGNHDFYSPSSFYHSQALQAYGFAPWPQHVMIFDSPQFKTTWLPGWEGKVSVTGRAFDDNPLAASLDDRSQERLLQQLPSQEPSTAVSLLLFHGARDDANRFEGKITAPFSSAELLALNFDYAAVGHYHRLDVFTNAAGEIKGAYAGSPFGRGLDETGPKYALIGELVKEGSAPARVTLEKLPLDPRQILNRTIAITGQESFEAIQAQVVGDLSLLAQAQDMVYCQLVGQLPGSVDLPWDVLEATLNMTYFHVRLDVERVTPAYDLDRFLSDPYSLEGRFVRLMREQTAQATETDRAVLEQAMLLGLDALTGNEVRRP